MNPASAELAGDLAVAAEELLADLPRRRRTAQPAASGRAEWDALADAGWFSVLLPEALGGLGLGAAELAGMSAAVGRHLAGGALVEQAVAGPLAAAAAEGNAAERLLAACAGERVVTLADPLAVGQDPADVIVVDGLVDGEVGLVRGAQHADELLVLAGARESATVALVDCRAIGAESLGSFDDCVSQDRVRFDLTPALVIADGRHGGRLAESIRMLSRAMLACELAGIARRVIELSVAYANQRRQFGRPIGAFQALAHLIADGYADVVTVEAHVRSALRDLTPIAAAAVKADANRVARRACETALQVHGGIGFTVEHDLHRYYKHALALQGLYGDEHSLCLEIGREEFGSDR
jgi:alkylation response protein AidB-like acyl-CoA dehydrogenase